MTSPEAKPLMLSSGRIIAIRQAPMKEALVIAARLAPLSKKQPTVEADQIAALRAIAQLVAPYIEGCDESTLAAAFIETPYDMPTVIARVIGSRSGTPRGKPKQRR